MFDSMFAGPNLATNDDQGSLSGSNEGSGFESEGEGSYMESLMSGDGSLVSPSLVSGSFTGSTLTEEFMKVSAERSEADERRVEDEEVGRREADGLEQASQLAQKTLQCLRILTHASFTRFARTEPNVPTHQPHLRLDLDPSIQQPRPRPPALHRIRRNRPQETLQTPPRKLIPLVIRPARPPNRAWCFCKRLVARAADAGAGLPGRADHERVGSGPGVVGGCEFGCD